MSVQRLSRQRASSARAAARRQCPKRAPAIAAEAGRAPRPLWPRGGSPLACSRLPARPFAGGDALSDVRLKTSQSGHGRLRCILTSTATHPRPSRCWLGPEEDKMCARAAHATAARRCGGGEKGLGKGDGGGGGGRGVGPRTRAARRVARGGGGRGGGWRRRRRRRSPRASSSPRTARTSRVGGAATGSTRGWTGAEGTGR